MDTNNQHYRYDIISKECIPVIYQGMPVNATTHHCQLFLLCVHVTQMWQYGQEASEQNVIVGIAHQHSVGIILGGHAIHFPASA